MEGNQMKMREALERLYNKIVSMQCDTSSQKRKVDECRMIIRKMLSLSPRNCDVGTAEEQASRMRQFCTKQKRNGIINCGYCPIKHEYQRDCTLEWEQMPYETEGGAK